MEGKLLDRPASWTSYKVELAASRAFRVGTACIDPLAREASYAAQRERLQPQTLKVLIALARAKGQVVSRDELIDSCWDGRIVGEDVINRSISLLRAFADRAGGFTIETVPKTGYRLVETASMLTRPRRRWAIALIVGLIAVAITATLWMTRQSREISPPMPSIALLPFTGVTSDPIGQQLAVETRDSLAQTLSEGGFPVRLVTTRPVDRPADLFVTGDVKSDKGSARAVIRVEESKYRTIIYSHQFDASAEDIGVLPERVGAQVASVLSWTGALMVLDRRLPSDPAVTLEQLRQMTLVIEGGDPLGAYEISHRTAPREPNSAIAQLGLAFNTAFALGELPQNQRAGAVAAARNASTRAEALASQFGDVYIPWCILHSPVRTIECEDRLRAGMRRDPDAPFVSFFLSVVMESVGRSAEALDLARLSLATDRYKFWKIARLLRTLENLGRSAEADTLFRQASRWWPENAALILSRRDGMLAHGDFGAIERFEQGLGSKVQVDPIPVTLLDAIQQRDVTKTKIICSDSKTDAPKTCMMGLARLGDLDDAFAIADRIYPNLKGANPADEDRIWLENIDTIPIELLSSPAAAPLRKDRRFLALASRVGLLEYWRKGRLPDFCTIKHERVCSEIRDARKR